MSHQDLVNLHQAITNLNPNARIGGSGIDDLTWNVGTPIPKSEIEAEIVLVEAEYDAQEYARNRQAEYPDWGTQLNKIYDDGIDKWKTEMVDPVKVKWPKDNSGPV
jgi:hypothetical protein